MKSTGEVIFGRKATRWTWSARQEIKTLCKPFLLSLVDTHPPVSYHNQGGGWRFGIGGVRSSRPYLDTRGLGHCSARYHKDRTPQGVFGILS